MSAPKLTAAQVRALEYLVHVGRKLVALHRGSHAPFLAVVRDGFAETQSSEFGDCWAVTDAGRAALAAHEAGARSSRTVPRTDGWRSSLPSRRKMSAPKLTDADWERVFELRCQSKLGKFAYGKDRALLNRAYYENPERYTAMNGRIFEATAPMGSNAKWGGK